MSYKYQILSPDGFPIDHDFYTSKKKAQLAFFEWLKRYEAQGYYSDARRNHIPLSDIAERCDLIKI